ncbi:MAG TPA: Na+/H+ antiporter subunit G [Burkholderiaceae bacterium]
MSTTVYMLVEVLVSLLLLASGVLVFTGALGLLRLRSFFMRMHPPALASTLGAWCVALAAVVYFSVLARGLQLQAVLIIIFLAITVPITTIFLARAALFRLRQANAPGVPPRLTQEAGAPESGAEGSAAKHTE